MLRGEFDMQWYDVFICCGLSEFIWFGFLWFPWGPPLEMVHGVLRLLE